LFEAAVAEPEAAGLPEEDLETVAAAVGEDVEGAVEGSRPSV